MNFQSLYFNIKNNIEKKIKLETDLKNLINRNKLIFENILVLKKVNMFSFLFIQTLSI